MSVAKIFEPVKSFTIGFLWNFHRNGCCDEQREGLDQHLPQITDKYFPASTPVVRGFDWLELPDDVLCLIAHRLIDVKDYIRFGAVCKHFRSVYVDVHKDIPTQVPVLIIPTQLDHAGKTRSFYNVSEKRIYPSKLPIPHNIFISNSSHGWLVTVTDDMDVSLFNSFLSVDNEIHLPSLITLGTPDMLRYPDYLKKAVLTANPASNRNYLVLAIYGGLCRLAFCKPGDKAWTKVDLEYAVLRDVIYYRHRLYFVDHTGAVSICEFDLTNEPKLLTVLPPPFTGDSVVGKYLVESSGDLLLIKRNRVYYDDDESYNYDTLGFIVFKLDLTMLKWIEVKSLRDRIVFVGHNSSLSLSTLDFPGCKPNCIYFTDDHIEGYTDIEEYGVRPHDMGVYHLEDKSIEPHYPMESDMIMPPPIWIEPTPQLCWH